MAKKKQEKDCDFFWIAPGVVQIDGKEYGADQALPPVKVIGEEKFEKWVKAGKVGQKIAPVTSDDAAKVADLSKTVSDLTLSNGKMLKDAESVTAEKADLVKEVETLTTEKAELVKEVEALTAKNTELTDQVKSLTETGD